eukprot:TRINITY_DN41883_c0_g1_i1.p1 TRINITY_DN41883_c0_g1~~TRINITY_DN41883_c0_g1_i1.p1  ORF type:complete len:814 (-),score=213.42 TRINITY_DN41883_c0_g1_i1:90-2531(-)
MAPSSLSAKAIIQNSLLSGVSPMPEWQAELRRKAAMLGAVDGSSLPEIGGAKASAKRCGSNTGMVMAHGPEEFDDVNHSMWDPKAKGGVEAEEKQRQAWQSMVRRIHTVLANHAHLDREVSEAFQIVWGAKLAETEAAAKETQNPLAAMSAAAPSMGNLSVASSNFIMRPDAGIYIDFAAVVQLLSGVIAKLRMPHEVTAVRRWTADACRAFCFSRLEADSITTTQVRFVVDWVLRSLSESAVRRNPTSFYERKFLVGFDYDTDLANSGIQLSGPIVYGLYGNIWLHAKKKAAAGRKSTATNKLVKVNCSTADGGAGMLVGGGKRKEQVVISIAKHLCKLPPETISRRLQLMIEAEKVPYVLPLVAAFEDAEHIHLVYDNLAPLAVCAVDKVFDDMHRQHEEDARDGGGHCERSVQQFIWKLMHMLKPAHSRGLCHGSLRLGGIYLNDPQSLESMQVLEFGLYDFFRAAEARPPLSILTPMDFDPDDPVPPYRWDFHCIAEIAFLLLGGQPLYVTESSLEERRLQFKRGTICFADKAYSKTSESAKAFVASMLRPPQFRKMTKISANQEAAVHMSHEWFNPRVDSSGFEQFDELFDVTIMRRFDKWRNMFRLRTMFLKIVADNVSRKGLRQLHHKLRECHSQEDHPQPGRVSWNTLAQELQAICPSVTNDLLKKVNKAFGDNLSSPSIVIEELCAGAEAWRKKRVRETLWQVFARSKAFDGVMTIDECIEGLTAGVLHIWSRPLRVIDVIVPPETMFSPWASVGHGQAEEDLDNRISSIIEGCTNSQKDVVFQRMLLKTDGAQSLRLSASCVA